jgi:2-methylcitrate dehydratase
LALAATHAATLREVRGGSISAAKSIANAVVAENAILLTLLAAEGMTGPKFAIEGARGFAKVVLRDKFDAFFGFDGTPERFLSASVKFFPCFALAQGPIAAALDLRKQLPAPIAQAEKITVELADSQPARLRLGDPAGKMPTSHEAADHSIHYLVTMALLEGRVSVEQFDRERWLDDDVRVVMSRIDAKISNDFPPGPQKAFPCRVTAEFGDGGRCVVERLISPGHPAAQVAFAEVEDKFHSCAAGVLDDAVQREVVKMIEGIEGLRSVRPLMKLLASPRQ